jgi:hypothetical protein
MRRAVTQGQ